MIRIFNRPASRSEKRDNSKRNLSKINSYGFDDFDFPKFLSSDSQSLQSDSLKRSDFRGGDFSTENADGSEFSFKNAMAVKKKLKKETKERENKLLTENITNNQISEMEDSRVLDDESIKNGVGNTHHHMKCGRANTSPDTYYNATTQRIRLAYVSNKFSKSFKSERKIHSRLSDKKNELKNKKGNDNEKKKRRLGSGKEKNDVFMQSTEIRKEIDRRNSFCSINFADINYVHDVGTNFDEIFTTISTDSNFDFFSNEIIEKRNGNTSNKDNDDIRNSNNNDSSSGKNDNYNSNNNINLNMSGKSQNEERSNLINNLPSMIRASAAIENCFTNNNDINIKNGNNSNKSGNINYKLNSGVITRSSKYNGLNINSSFSPSSSSQNAISPTFSLRYS